MGTSKRVHDRVLHSMIATCLALALLAVCGSRLWPAYAATAATGWLADVNGRVTPIGSAPNLGDLAGVALHAPVIAVAARPGGAGYWMAALDGGVFAFGGAPFHGSMGGTRLNQPVVGMAPTPSGQGYWLVAADGGVFTFGDARYYGSLGAVRLHRPVGGLVATPSGRGYWLVASDGGVFAFGDAGFFGSGRRRAAAVPTATIAAHTHGARVLAPRPVRRRPWVRRRTRVQPRVGDDLLAVGIVATPSGSGYWIANSDGTLQSFGDASAFGSPSPPRAAIVGLATPWGSSSGFALPLIEFLQALQRATPRHCGRGSPRTRSPSRSTTGRAPSRRTCSPS